MNKDKRYVLFEKWLKENSYPYELIQREKDSLSALNSIGIQKSSMFSESDPNTVRLYTSELVIKRNRCNLKSISEYEQVLRFLVLYAEFLENKDSNNMEISKEKGKRDVSSDSLVIAYYLSREDRKAVQDLGYKSFSDAFKGIAALLGQKASTIKNMRDEFDPYFDNGRAGWYQRSLSPSRKAVFEKYSNTTDEDLANLVKEIIRCYSSKDITPEKEKHKKIKISNGNMKEFKSKKK